MSTSTLDASAALQWPADRFYWVVLDRQDSLSATPTVIELQESLQDDLPCAASDLAFTVNSMSSDHLLVCGVPKELLGSLPPHIIHCGPASFPEWLKTSHSENLPQLGEINFLTGPFTPPFIRRHQRHRALWLSGLTLAATLLLAIGLHRRANHAESLAGKYQSQLKAVASQTLGTPVTASQAADLLKVRLDRNEILQRAGTQTSVDIGSVTAQFLAGWPSDLPETPRVEILSASRDQLSLSITTPGDPQELITRLKPPTGWKLLEPRLSARGTSTQIQLEFRPQKGGAS
jgi:hypothetical protein